MTCPGTEISRELSLWSQKGSRVIRGNLLAIPIGDTFVYVEPVYLEARQEESEQPTAGTPQTRPFSRPQRGSARGPSQQERARSAALPELKRVIVASGNRLVMEENLDKALSSVLGERVFAERTAPPALAPTQDKAGLGLSALEHYNRAKDYLRQGNWAEYGRELENLEKVLKEMADLTKEKK